MEETKCPKEGPERSKWAKSAWTHLNSVRAQNPLIQCITNFVSMDLMANTLLSAGASPAMIHSEHESPDFTPKAHALCINIGTLSGNWVLSMKVAAGIAFKLGKPWVLDPVAAGGSGYRLKVCLELLELRPTVIRGNATEIRALVNNSVTESTGGVDSTHMSIDALEAAKSLALSTGAVVAVSGAVDIVTDGVRVVGASNGVAMLQKITATGCAVTAMIAAFVTVDPSHVLEATASALSVFGIAAEMGAEAAKGPASLRVNLIDSLYGLDETAVLARAQIAEWNGPRR